MPIAHLKHLCTIIVLALAQPALANSIGWFGFIQHPGNPQEPELVLADLKTNGRAQVFARVPQFSRGGQPDLVTIRTIAMGPNGDFMAVHFETADALAENYTAMVFTKYGEQVDQFDDLGFETEISRRCGISGTVVQPYITTALDDAANGATSPTVTGARLDFVDTDGNQIGQPRWISDHEIELHGYVAMNLTYLDSAGPEIDLGVIPSVPIYLSVSRQSRDYLAPWHVTRCRATPFPAPTLLPDLSIMLGVPRPNGHALEWKGTTITKLNGAALSPLGATHVAGPFKPYLP